MPIDPSIPLQVQPLKLESPMNQLAMMEGAMKMGEMQRSMGVQNELRNLYSQGVDVSTPEGFNKLASIDPKTAMALRNDALQGQKLQGDIKKTGFEIDEKKLNIIRERSKDILQNLSPENFIAHTQENVRDGLVTPEQGQRAIANYIATPPDKRAALINQNLARAEKVYEMNTISAAQQQTNATTLRGQNLTYGATIRGQDLTNDPTLQGNLAAAKAAGTTKGKAIATAEINLPGVIATGQELERKIYEMVGKPPVYKDGKLVQAGTAPHAGFKGAVGMGSWKTLGIPGVEQLTPGSAASDFKARFDEVMGGAFEEAYNTLKGGGSITEKEGEKATAAKTRMRLAQSEKEFMIAAREYAGVVNKGIERAKAKAASGGSTPAGGEIDFNSLK